MVLWAGNALRDTNLRYTGLSNDRDPILVRLGGTMPTNVVAGYYTEDRQMLSYMSNDKLDELVAMIKSDAGKAA